MVKLRMGSIVDKYTKKGLEICLCLAFFFLPLVKAALIFFVWFAILLWLIRKIFFKVKLCSNELNKPILILIFVNILSLVTSQFFWISFNAFLTKFLRGILLFYVIVDSINIKQVKNILISLYLSSIVVFCDAFFQLIIGKDFIRSYALSENKVSAAFANPTGFAAWIIAVIFIFLSQLLLNKSNADFIKKISFVLTLAFSIFLLMTYNRGAWIGFLLGAVLFYTYFIYQKKIVYKKIILIILLFCIVVFFFAYLYYDNVTKVRPSPYESANYRLIFWEQTLCIVEDFPLLGTGLNTFTKMFNYYYPKLDYHGYAHNSYLQMAAEIGVVGLISFLYMIFIFLKNAFKFINSHCNPLFIGITIGLNAFLVHSFFDVHFYSFQLNILFWFMLGLAIKVKILEI